MTTTVVATALAKEKVWYDKPNYDKAERRYFEKLAKVMSHKIMEGCTLKSDNTITDKCRDLIDTNTLKSKAEKSKDNKLTLENESNELNIKRSKCQGRSAKANKEAADICNMQNKGNIKATEKSDSSKYNAKEEESTSLIEKSKKYNAKEAKEKKNKEDTRNKNRESEENYIGENKETAMPFTTNKEQLSDQMQAIRFASKPRAGSLANEVAKARQHIKWSLQCMNDIAARADVNEDVTPSDKVENENEDLRDLVQDLKNSLDTLVQRVKNLEALEQRVESLEVRTPYIAICPAKPMESLETEQESEQTNSQDKDRKQSKETDDDDDDNDDVDIDLFNSDSEGEDAEAAKVREERLAAYAAKKSKKPVLIAKSNIILDVKPWDDETNMEEMEKAVRNIEMDGLLWGASKLQPLAYSIYKLQISCVVEDDKVSVDMLTERIEEIEEYVQSVDIAAFNKV